MFAPLPLREFRQAFGSRGTGPDPMSHAGVSAVQEAAPRDDAALVTRNTQDFERVPGLRMIGC